MKALVGLAALLPFVLILTGCFGPSAPKCSDTDTIELVKSIALEHIGASAKSQKEQGYTVEFSVEAIRTTGQNKETGAYQCAAELHQRFAETGRTEDIKSQSSITFESSLTDDGKQYVTVRGL